MHALIIGGGIGGTAAAMALQRANIQATVYEAYTYSAGLITGAYLTVAVNGLQALREIGVSIAFWTTAFLRAASRFVAAPASSSAKCRSAERCRTAR